MRICIFGAGAIGGNIAGRLHKAGVTPAIVARGAHLAAIQANGLEVRYADGDVQAVKARASDDARDLGPQDLVIVTAKAPALPSVAAGIGPLLGPETAVLFVMNGIPWWYFQNHGGPHDDRRLAKLDPGDALRRAVAPERVIGGTIYSSCSVVRPGVVEVTSSINRLILGEPTGAATPRVEAIAKLLAAGGIAAPVTRDIRDAVWTKLISNFSSGPLAALTQSNFKTLFAEEVCRDAVRRTVAEGVAIAAAMGRRAEADAEDILKRLSPSAHKPSILQDLELGRPMEVDAIYTVPLEMARLAGLATPTLDLLVGLLKLRAASAGLYGGSPGTGA
ncbi:MAG: ketopantoate reductase family protein [Alphaproteobacteria bacterium]